MNWDSEEQAREQPVQSFLHTLSFPQTQSFPQAPGMPMMTTPKNPAIALIVSFFIPGLGSMINGRIGIGVTILLVYIVGAILSFVLIGIPIAIGAWIWGMVDGYRSAQNWNRAHGLPG